VGVLVADKGAGSAEEEEEEEAGCVNSCSLNKACPKSSMALSILVIMRMLLVLVLVLPPVTAAFAKTGVIGSPL
jgi:hypothetical protein